MPRIHERREVPAQPPSLPGTEAMKTYWDAYWDFRLLIIQMCFSVKSEKPPTSGDVKMGQTLNETICDNFEQNFPAISEGAKCDHKDSFERLNSIVKALCALAREGEKYVQSLALLCHVQDTLKGKVYECGGEEDGVVSGTGTMIAASLMETFDSGPSITKEEPAPSADVEATPDSSHIASDVPSFSLQQNAVADANLPPVSTSASLVALASEPQLITSAASLVPSPVLPTPPVSGNSPVPVSLAPPPDINAVPPHHSNTPPADWTIPMLTYTTQPYTDADEYTLLRTVPTDGVAQAPIYSGEHLSRDWPDLFPFSIPTGYVAPNIVPAEPQIGHLTEFGPGGVGACGGPDMKSNELAVAVSWVLFQMDREIGGSPLEENWVFLGTHDDGRDMRLSALCFRGIRMWMADDQGKKLVEQEVVVRDMCTACNVTHLDMQKGTFDKYWDGGGKGRISVTWEWMQEAPTDVPG
ncbi:uncharacterized protein J4E84_000710 [Alternaria hordeiaustralica]|uniref:uncharacterized protein n=1 Tax=Alternaria hordeiaustralica TaxID=1187925 RepID=UPI0020C5513F|nr:uncharacterized protein J4E84_000710 [Alternaria hordeiaustralica]KAI4697578.1 hypothetical protein J4E84_000710 [Alternaria hordeiaustralica]